MSITVCYDKYLRSRDYGKHSNDADFDGHMKRIYLYLAGGIYHVEITDEFHCGVTATNLATVLKFITIHS